MAEMMSIDLSKEIKVKLAKEDGTPIRNLFIGMNWGKNTYSGQDDFDVDLNCFVTDVNRKVTFPADIINYKFSQKHFSGVVEYSGDNRDGSDNVGVNYNGKHYDEAMYVHTDKFPTDKEVLTFFGSIYNAHKRYQNFGMIGNARIDIIDMDDPSTSYFLDLSNEDDFEDLTALVFIEIRKTSSGCKLIKMSKGYTGGTKEIYSNFGMQISGDDY